MIGTKSRYRFERLDDNQKDNKDEWSVRAQHVPVRTLATSDIGALETNLAAKPPTDYT